MHKVGQQKPPIAQKIANFFGAMGYLSLLLEWFWVVGLLLQPLIVSGTFNWLITPPTAPQTPQPTYSIDPTIGLIIGIVTTVLCLAVTVYALYFIPRSVGKTGAAVTQLAAKNIAPAITHHKPISKKRAKRLSYQIVTALKFILIALPLFVAFCIPQFAVFTKNIVLTVTLFCAALAVVNFCAQLLVVKVRRLNTDTIW